ncbi:phosphatase PAP2 family protein [Patescibacteria group bacterium]
MIENFQKRVFWCVAFIFVGGGLYLLMNKYGSLSDAYYVQFEFEKYIPFIPWTIIIYFLIFPYLSLPVFLVKRYKDFFKVVLGLWGITFASAFIFWQYPTTMLRPEIIEGGIVGILFNVIRFIDGPYNLFPSLHVSSISFVAFVNHYFRPKTDIWSIPLAILICCSTLTVKQHAILDVLGGFALGFIVYFVVFKLFFRRKKTRA